MPRASSRGRGCPGPISEAGKHIQQGPPSVGLSSFRRVKLVSHARQPYLFVSRSSHPPCSRLADHSPDVNPQPPEATKQNISYKTCSAKTNKRITMAHGLYSEIHSLFQAGWRALEIGPQALWSWIQRCGVFHPSPKSDFSSGTWGDRDSGMGEWSAKLSA